MSLDLTTTYPKSVHEKLFGLAQIARTIDKGKATAHGNVGEYHYNCGMDQAVFTFLGIDHEQLLDAIKNANSDDEIHAYVKTFVDKKSPEEIEQWNQQWLNSVPTGDSLNYFTELRNTIAPDRTDVTNWPDLLDLDEKRTVPIRQTANV